MSINLAELQEAARLKSQAVLVDPFNPDAVPLIVQRVVPMVDAPQYKKHQFRSAQAAFTIFVSGKHYAVSNYRFETDDDTLALAVERSYPGVLTRTLEG